MYQIYLYTYTCIHTWNGHGKLGSKRMWTCQIAMILQAAPQWDHQKTTAFLLVGKTG